MNHEVINQDEFGHLDGNNVDFIIVVQVHNRIDYLKYLLGSLSRVKHIERALLVFSYDLNSDSMIELFHSIDFCRVIHIFFPFNIQLFPNVYPGHSPLDCPEGAKKTDVSGCDDAEFPDIHGHFRIPKLAQIKHHWWWKINYVFEGIVPKYSLEDKLLVLLEEDHIVSPDLLYTLIVMREKRQKICPDCELLCLGTYPKSFSNYEQDIRKLGVEFWYSSKFNMGMVINKKLWNRIQNYSQFFCSYDDYNWDWTLLQLSVKCMPTKMRVIYTKAPRVIHIGDCGVHTHRCNADRAVHDALKLFERVNGSFFPSSMEISEINKRMLKPSKPNGGWGDPRDRYMCEMNTHPIISNAIELFKSSRLALEKEKAKNSTIFR